MSIGVIHVRIPGIVVLSILNTQVHIQNTCPLVHLCHTYYISTSEVCLQMFYVLRYTILTLSLIFTGIRTIYSNLTSSAMHMEHYVQELVQIHA